MLGGRRPALRVEVTDGGVNSSRSEPGWTARNEQQLNNNQSYLNETTPNSGLRHSANATNNGSKTAHNIIALGLYFEGSQHTKLHTSHGT